MFDFEKLKVYQKAQDLHADILKICNGLKNTDVYSRDQLKRASLSVVLNIAEGSGKFSKADRARFFRTARGSVYECVAVLDSYRRNTVIDENVYSHLYNRYEEVSKMLLGLIRS